MAIVGTSGSGKAWPCQVSSMRFEILFRFKVPSVMKIISCIGVFAVNRISKSSHAYVFFFLGSLLIL